MVYSGKEYTRPLKALNIRAPKNSTSNHIRTSLCYLLAGERKAKYTPIQRNGTKVAQKRHNAPLRIFWCWLNCSPFASWNESGTKTALYALRAW